MEVCHCHGVIKITVAPAYGYVLLVTEGEGVRGSVHFFLLTTRTAEDSTYNHIKLILTLTILTTLYHLSSGINKLDYSIYSTTWTVLISMDIACRMDLPAFCLSAARL